MYKLVLSVLIVLAAAVSANAAEPVGKIWFTEPKDGATVSNPVRFCFAQEGLKVMEWKKEKAVGEGHHHLLIDIGFPKSGKDKFRESIMHYKSSCKILRKPLSKGKHVIRGMFSHNNHDPYWPIIGTTITINVE